MRAAHVVRGREDRARAHPRMLRRHKSAAFTAVLNKRACRRRPKSRILQASSMVTLQVYDDRKIMLIDFLRRGRIRWCICERLHRGTIRARLSGDRT
jgi:hypothetical protein